MTLTCSRIAAAAMVALSLAIASCDKVQTPLPEIKTDPTKAGSPDSKNEDQNAFSQSAQLELAELKAKLEELKVKSREAGKQTKNLMEKEIERLESDFQTTQQKLSDLKAATTDGWKQMKDAVRQSIEKLRADINSARKSNP